MRVRFEPIGESIECGPDETVLDAAFRSGYNLVHGCREGQCSACKCFLLEGDAELKPYSTFALSDSERSSGYSLMCRAMPAEDLVVELLHYDTDGYRLEHAIQTVTAEVQSVAQLTSDIVRLVLRSEAFSFTPGQYVDLHVPGSGGARRSFSMANLPGDGRIELIIKRYEGGRFSALLGGTIAPGDTLELTGPYGSLRIRESERPILMIAGGSGMAPILSLLRRLAASGCPRPVRFYYGARTEADLFLVDEIAALGEAVGDFRFHPVVGGFVHEAVDDELEQPDVYMCGPPPMVEAAEAMLAGRGIADDRIFVDKFTTSADAPGAAVPGAAVPGAKPADEREFAWFAPAGRRASLYEDVTIDTQPSVHRHLQRDWPLRFEDGRGIWDDASTALRSADWFAFRDPGEQWERPFYQLAAAAERQLEAAVRAASADGLLADYSPEWVAFLRETLQVPAFVEHGLWFALATIGRDCLSDSVATCVCLQAAMKQRSAQAIVLYAMDLERDHGPFPIDAARRTFLEDPTWQPARRFLERLAATPDWGEVIVAANVCFEPIVGTLIRRELGIRAAAASGDTVTPVLARAAGQEWSWARAWTVALLRMLLADRDHGAANRETIAGWVESWQPLAVQAARAIAGRAPAAVDLERLLAGPQAILADAEPAPVHAPAGARRVRPAAASRRVSNGASAGSASGSASASASASAADGHDYVGIVMAKSAEGDAVAEVLARREEIEVIEQPSFWDIRARERLSLPYADVSEQLGYAIDAYSIQHEMSTHYGRMVATDDALMLFSDPTEAMQYLMS